MRGFLHSPKLRAIIVPILIFLVLSMVLISTILKQEQRLPSKGWSRGIELNSTLSFDTYPIITEENGEFHIFTKSDEAVNGIVLNNKFETEKTTSLPVKVPDFTQFWTDGKLVAFVKNNQLIKVEKGRSSVLAQPVEGLTPFGHNIIFWKSNQLFELNPSSHQIIKLAQTPYPIDTVVVKPGFNYMLIQSQKINNEAVFLGVVPLNTNKEQYHLIDTIGQTYNSILLDLDFVIHQNSMYVVYCEFGATSGGTYRNNYFGAYNLKTFKKQFNSKPINIIDASTEMPFDQPTKLRINWIDGELALLFQDQSTLFNGEDAQNIFLAKEHGDTWVARPISSTVEPSENPVWLTANSVLWNDHIGNNYTLMLGSQNPKQIQISEHVTQKDWGDAISRALINMTISLLMFTYALLWVIPTMVFIIGMYIGNMTLMERNPYWVRVVAVLLFLITQLIFIKGIFDPTFYQYSPPFLQFTGNWIIIPIILAGVSFSVTEWVKGKEWGNSMCIFYCLMIDVLMLGFLIGPYTL